MRYAIVLFIALAVGCPVVPGPQPPGPNPDPEPQPFPTGAWSVLAHDASVNAAKGRAAALREAATKQWASAEELATWLDAEVKAMQTKAYQPGRDAVAQEFADGWDWERHKAIILQQAAGYESVK